MKDSKNLQPLVSIIIPTFNGAKFLSEAIQSALDQTYRPIEIIVVDDGSTDNTQEIIASYTGYSCFKSVFQSNKGQASARNLGLRLAGGLLIQFLDDDDLLFPEKLTKQVEFLLNNPDIFAVYCTTRYFTTVPQQFHSSLAIRLSADPKRQIFKSNFLPILSVLLRKSDLFFDESLRGLEDWDYWIRLLLQERKISFYDEALCSVRTHRGNMTNDNLRMCRDTLKVLAKFTNCPHGREERLLLQFAMHVKLGSWRECRCILKKIHRLGITYSIKSLCILLKNLLIRAAPKVIQKWRLYKYKENK